VDLFLAGRIPFPQIVERVQRVMEAHPVSKNPGLEEILHADAWARSAAVDGA
jgi:1-deoxy-D-xylulose-5-phosphate reductoisomerase